MDLQQTDGVFDDVAFRAVSGSLKRKINQEACAYWNSIRGSRRIPMRSDFDPAGIRRLLPSVILLDVLRPEFDFRYRLIGTRWVMHFGRDYTGLLMSKIKHQRQPSRVWDAVSKVVQDGMPLSPDLPYVGHLFGGREIEVLISPLSRGGEQVDLLFVTVDFSE
jgi:hypothetical protein